MRVLCVCGSTLGAQMACESANALSIPPVQAGVHTREPGPGAAPTVTLEAPNTAVPTRGHEGNALAWKDGGWESKGERRW